MQLYLKIWRQKDRNAEGKLEAYKLDQLNPHMSFLEMLDTLNEKLILEGKEPVEFDHDCREGICGQCGMMINGIAHGPLKNTTTCQLHLRSFEDGDTIVIEPFRAAAFPVKKDLKVDRSALDRIIASGGFVSVNTGQAPDAKTIAITHQLAEEAFDAAACIGCGACVATCKNASAALFTSAKISHMALLPQGKEERNERVVNMVKQMDEELFGHCSNTEACEVECPQGISVLNIARMNYEYSRALFYKKN
ncbi:TPA: succinate dehydrogenase/fumarate reductase iron-sulfur subunit [Elizabethkingia anophelis]|uniref:succinate dehydrogenase/fumarate reductase iron-sulfur subunit n=1 Tax=Elizabethkingia anophelis TaxID=1117645 RepID=UPI0016232BD3|nr:succinate dehydrogenase/fumarate reductase iron-sulfur subunit [Elizabethkingia anophelis]MCT3673064.1 succinate dehydrogenase/fumarate reductase iron-sulfur subunit [Elizabethkingia anophelis]MCT3679904.1 succinate dehydrogenase/fumarate reductase iron-sulfur subunit [Elizabethkingia anophelis]MCT3700879.1 succinate dehydrogenase/fumarate reductase iron-sulfur subunit [Elizabethkingia anophelis]MCT3768715.1 succinate dehydrogenase/fumarate reductase iron-sulfur subunit [Elizabethkingia anop